MNLKDIYNSRAFQKGLFISAVAIGGLGMASSFYLASKGAPAALLGVLPSSGMFGLGCFGMYHLQKPKR